jgi:hypothetical protein
VSSGAYVYRRCSGRVDGGGDKALEPWSACFDSGRQPCCVEHGGGALLRARRARPRLVFLLARAPVEVPRHIRRSGDCRPRPARPECKVALDVKVILTPPACLYISLVILHTKYTGWRQNDFTANV